jgi:hypothetical protein
VFFRRMRRPAAPEIEQPRSHPALSADERHSLFAYEMLVLRTGTQANLVWQTPSLGLTAQAFLLTIALEAQASDLRRVVAAFLGLVVALISMQTMAKHRYFENLDNFKMQQLEQRLGLPPMARRGWDGAAASIGRFSVPKKWPVRLSSLSLTWSSYRVWQIGLAAFALVDVAIIILDVTYGSVFDLGTSRERR